MQNLIKQAALPAALYAGAINVGSFTLFGYDKYQATHKGWRIPEKTLQLSALLGGWIGGMMAMKYFRHKTVKKSFQEPYMLATLGNIAACAAGLFALRRPGMLMGLNKQTLIGKIYAPNMSTTAMDIDLPHSGQRSRENTHKTRIIDFRHVDPPANRYLDRLEQTLEKRLEKAESNLASSAQDLQRMSLLQSQASLSFISSRSSLVSTKSFNDSTPLDTPRHSIAGPPPKYYHETLGATIPKRHSVIGNSEADLRSSSVRNSTISSRSRNSEVMRHSDSLSSAARPSISHRVDSFQSISEARHKSYERLMADSAGHFISKNVDRSNHTSTSNLTRTKSTSLGSGSLTRLYDPEFYTAATRNRMQAVKERQELVARSKLAPSLQTTPVAKGPVKNAEYLEKLAQPVKKVKRGSQDDGEEERARSGKKILRAPGDPPGTRRIQFFNTFA